MPETLFQRFAKESESTPSSTVNPKDFTKKFLKFITDNPTVYHVTQYCRERLVSAGFEELSERDIWHLKTGGKYFFVRNSSGLIAFKVGEDWKPGKGAVIIAAHIDALTAKLKPISKKPTSQGYIPVGVAQYSGALNQTWFDRDLSISGRVFVKDPSGKIHEKLVSLPNVARIPTIAPHFGVPAEGQANRETRMVPIIGLDNDDLSSKDYPLAGASSFVSTQPPRLVKAVAGELGVKDLSTILNFDLEMHSAEAAVLGGIDKDLLFAARLDDKLCSFAALEALIASSSSSSSTAGTLSVAGLFDNEEIGSLTRQGAKSNFLPSTIERIVESFASKSINSLVLQTYANSFLVSADVCHAVNSNYLDYYLADHMPRLNIGLAVSFDSNNNMTTDGVSSTIMNRIAEKCDCKLQVFQIRNDSRSGGTVGPMLSSMTGIRAVDAGIPQLSMHSIRATTGSEDVYLGFKMFLGCYEHFEAVDKEFT